MERWQAIDTRTEPDPLAFAGDPADVIDAYGELLSLLERPWWHQHAACRGQGWEPWFPGRGQASEPAKAICAGCAVRDDCLAASLALPPTEVSGIWGGVSERQRRHLRRSAA